jgi:hypothetical protein
LIARSLAGPWAGRLAAAALAAEPNFLAHASLATTDIAVTACLLALAYHYREGRQLGWVWRVGLPALWCAAALLAKASTVAFAPLILLAVECEFLFRDGWPGYGAVARSLCHLLLIGVLGFLLASLYCGSHESPARKNLVAAVDRLPDVPGKAALGWAARKAPLYTHAWDAIFWQVRHNQRGHDGVFLLGTWHSGKSVWDYFPVALAIKLTLPMLILPLVLAWLRPQALANWAVVAAAVLLAFSLTCRIQIGIRYMLPLVALGAVGVSAAVLKAWEAMPDGWQRRGLVAVGVVAILGMAAASVNVWPNGLCYANRLWGGPERSYLLLSDSNSDWGQGLKELVAWQRAHGAERMDVVYFGTDPSLHRLPLRPASLPETGVGSSGYLAVSTTALYGHPHSETPAAARLRAMRPVARTSTFLIYRLPRVGPPAG